MAHVLEVYESEDIGPGDVIIPVVYVESYHINANGDYEPDTGWPLGEFYPEDVQGIMDRVGEALTDGDYDVLQFKVGGEVFA